MIRVCADRMENKEVTTNPLPPQTLQRIEKLKVYAILSGEKGEKLIAVKDKLVLSLILAYNDSEAVMAANKMIQMVGKQPETYQIPFMLTKADIDKLIPELNHPKLVPVLMESQVEVSPEDMIEYVKQIFKIAGTANQRKVAGAVIDKYKHHVKYLPKIPFEHGGPYEAN